MTKRIIDRLYGLPFALIILILLITYMDLFPLPSWLLGVVCLWAAVAFFVEGMKQRKKKA